ncbi:MAG: TRAP transporter small permease, partial [Limnohabitans sp.]
YIVYGTYLQHDILQGNASPVAQISMIWVFGVSYLTGTFIGIMCLFNLLRLLAGQVDESELSDVMEEGMSEVDEMAAEVGRKA